MALSTGTRPKELAEQCVAERPVTEAGVGVEVAVCAGTLEAAAPGIREGSGAIHRDVGVVAARHHDARKGQALPGHRREADGFLRVRRSLGVTWRHEKGAGDGS